MKTEGLIGEKASVHFRRWNIDRGPAIWDDDDVWREIEEALASGKVPQAAAMLRNYLEYSAREVCHRLRAEVEFRGDDRWELGDMLPRATARLKRLLVQGREAAESWRRKDLVEQLDVRRGRFEECVNRSKVEEWQINRAVHYNEWDGFQKEDFVPVVTTFRELLEEFKCPKCHAYVYVTPQRGEREAVRCYCGEINLSLLRQRREAQ